MTNEKPRVWGLHMGEHVGGRPVDGAAFHHVASSWRGLFTADSAIGFSDVKVPHDMLDAAFQDFVDQVMRDVVPPCMRWKTS